MCIRDRDDATRFALLLEAQDFPVPTVEAMDSGDIEAFCREADYEYEIVGDGMLAIPPENNVPEPDWDTANPKPTEAEEMSLRFPRVN